MPIKILLRIFAVIYLIITFFCKLLSYKDVDKCLYQISHNETNESVGDDGSLTH